MKVKDQYSVGTNNQVTVYDHTNGTVKLITADEEGQKKEEGEQFLFRVNDCAVILFNSFDENNLFETSFNGDSFTFILKNKRIEIIQNKGDQTQRYFVYTEKQKTQKIKNIEITFYLLYQEDKKNQTIAIEKIKKFIITKRIKLDALLCMLYNEEGVLVSRKKNNEIFFAYSKPNDDDFKEEQIELSQCTNLEDESTIKGKNFTLIKNLFCSYINNSRAMWLDREELHEDEVDIESKIVSISVNEDKEINDKKSFQGMVNDFGAKIFEIIRETEKGKSFTFSNINMMIALMSLLTMIKESKKEDFLKTLGFEGMEEMEVHKALGKVFKENQLSKIGTINIFNTLASKGDLFHESVKTTLSKFYNIDTIIDNNLKDKINEKISKETKGLITDLVKDNDLSAAFFSTLYLELLWEGKPFKKTGTMGFHIDDNTIVKVPSLTKTASFRVGNNDGVRSIAIPYESPENQKIFLIIFMSDKVSINNNQIKQVLGEPYTPTNLFMPEINLDSPEVNLLKIFESTKLPIALDPEMINALSHLDFIQKSKLEINKVGTKAASATSILYFESGSKYKTTPKDFKVDRPFTYVIATQDTENKEITVLLSGVISDKSALVLE